MKQLSLQRNSDGKFTGHLWVHAPRNDSASGRIGIPVAMLGNNEGPTALLIGGIHGDEFIGPVALNHLYHAVDPQQIKGRVLICPTANISAVRANLRFSPEDTKNMNRFFPGNPGGTLTERVCYEITQQLISASDFVIDVHSGGRSLEYSPGSIVRYSGNPEIDKSSWQLAEAFGAPISYITKAYNGFPSHTSSVALSQKKPSIAMEIGGSELITPQNVDIVYNGIVNVLRTKGIISGEPKETKTRPVLLDDKDSMLSPEDGLFVPTAKLGDFGTPEQQVGLLYGLEDIERGPKRLYFPMVSELVCLRRVTNVKRGDTLFQFGMDGAPLVKNGFVPI